MCFLLKAVILFESNSSSLYVSDLFRALYCQVMFCNQFQYCNLEGKKAQNALSGFLCLFLFFFCVRHIDIILYMNRLVAQNGHSSCFCSAPCVFTRPPHFPVLWTHWPIFTALLILLLRFQPLKCTACVRSTLFCHLVIVCLLPV